MCRIPWWAGGDRPIFEKNKEPSMITSMAFQEINGQWVLVVEGRAEGYNQSPPRSGPTRNADARREHDARFTGDGAGRGISP